MTDQVAPDPFGMLTEVGCVNEQIDAALGMVSDELHDEMESIQDEPGQERRRDRVYNIWLMLELVRKGMKANDQLFHEAESALLRARAGRQAS